MCILPYKILLSLMIDIISLASNIYTPPFPRILRLKVMIKEVKTQANVGVGVDFLWKALAKDLKDILPKMMPNLVKGADMLEGDGGLGTIYLFNFGPGESISLAYTNQMTELNFLVGSFNFLNELNQQVEITCLSRLDVTVMAVTEFFFAFEILCQV